MTALDRILFYAVSLFALAMAGACGWGAGHAARVGARAGVAWLAFLMLGALGLWGFATLGATGVLR